MTKPLTTEQLWGSSLGVATVGLVKQITDALTTSVVGILGQRMAKLLANPRFYGPDFDEAEFQEAFESAMNQAIEIEEMQMLVDQVRKTDNGD